MVPSGTNDSGHHSPMPSADFDELVAAMAAESFDSHRIKLLRKIAPNRWFTVEQLTEFLKTMDFDSPGRTEVAAIVYPRLVDVDNFTLVFLHLTHSSNRRLLEERMAQVPEYQPPADEPAAGDEPIPLDDAVETSRFPAPSPVAADEVELPPPGEPSGPITEPALKDPKPTGRSNGADAGLWDEPSKGRTTTPPARPAPDPIVRKTPDPDVQTVRSVPEGPPPSGGLWSLANIPWIIAGVGIIALSMALGYFAQKEIHSRAAQTPVPTVTIAQNTPSPTQTAAPTATARPTAPTAVAAHTPTPSRTRAPETPEQRDHRLAARHAAVGRAHHKAGRLQDARRELEEAIRLHESNARYHAWLALVLYDLDDLAGADKSARRAVSLNSREPWAHLALGNVHQAAGRNKQAIAEYKEFLRLQPSGPVAREVTAVVQMLEGS